MNDQALVWDCGGTAVSLKTSVAVCVEPGANKVAGVNETVMSVPDLEISRVVTGLPSRDNEIVLVLTCVEVPSRNTTLIGVSGNAPV